MSDKDTSLIERVEAYLKRTGMTATLFGKKALNDPNLVFDLREGRWLRGPTRTRVIQFMEPKKGRVPERRQQPDRRKSGVRP